MDRCGGGTEPDLDVARLSLKGKRIFSGRKLRAIRGMPRERQGM
jgi:hypothetical protein